MATIVSWNGTSFTVPATGEENWGGTSKVDGLLVSLAQNGFNKAGGLFTLSSDVDFGVTAGLVSQYYKSRATVATSGVLRMGNAEVIGWRNAAASGNNTLTSDASDRLVYNGTILASSAGVVPVASGGTNLTSYTTGDILYASAATVLSKLAIGAINTVQLSTGSAPSWALLANANVAAGAAIAYSKLTLTGSVVNADIAVGAVIAFSKMAALSLSQVVVTDGSGIITTAAVTPTALLNIASLTTAAVGTTMTQTLSGKTFSDPVTLTQVATPAAPSAGTNKLYTKSGNTLNWLDSSSVEHQAVDTQGGPYVLTNYLLNSNFDLWQRGTSVTIANTVSTYQPDRWYGKNTLGTNGVLTLSRVAGVSDGALYGAKLQITTAPTAAQVNGCELYQTLDNLTSLQLYNKTASFQVKVKSFGNVNQVGIQFFYKTTEAKVDTSIGAEQLTTVNTSTFTSCTISGQAIGTSQTTSGVVGVRIRITGVSSGNTYDLNNGFVVEQAIVSIGSSIATYTRANGAIAAEVEACQRYYQKSYDLDVAPANTGANGSIGFRANGTSHQEPVHLAPTMRAAATVTLYAPTSGTSGNWRDNSAGADRVVAASSIGMSRFLVSVTAAVDQNGMAGHFTADAEI